MKYTSEVFQRLSRGQFISSNSIDADTRAIYNDIEENQQEYEDYFSKIDFQLSCGDGFYYFSRKEAKVIIENKLQAPLRRPEGRPASPFPARLFQVHSFHHAHPQRRQQPL